SGRTLGALRADNAVPLSHAGPLCPPFPLFLVSSCCCCCCCCCRCCCAASPHPTIHPPRSMKRVTGIGGIFFKARDAKALQAWYKQHLGIDVQPWGGASFDWTDREGKPVAGTTA